jgi:hypothetical protein
VQEFFGDLKLSEESSEGLGPLNHSRERRMLKLLCRSHVPEKNHRVDFEPEVLEEEIERSNSPRRTPEITRTVRSREVTRRIRRDESITLVTGANVDR